MADDNEAPKMVAGDYMIHLLIQKGKNFKNEDAATIEAMFMATTCGITQYSETKSNCACMNDKGMMWSQHLFFEAKNMSKEDIEEAAFEIKLMDKGLFRDKVVGAFDVDIAQIYGMNDEHALQHQWVGMNNPEGENIQEITSYVQISVSIQGPGDNSVRLEVAKGEDPNAKVMMPASISKAYKQIKIGILDADQLPAMDSGLFAEDDLQAYIQCQRGKKKLKTPVVPRKAEDTKNGKTEIVFNQMMSFGTVWPTAQDRLILQVFDQDKLFGMENAGGDDVIGSLKFSLKYLVKTYSTQKERTNFTWRHVYGAPVDCDSEQAKAMNADPDIGTIWKGRVLLYIEVTDNDYPEVDVQPLDNEYVKLAESFGVYKPTKYELTAEIVAGICLPVEGAQYKVRFQVQNYSYTTEAPLEHSKNYNRWSQRLSSEKENNQVLNRTVESVKSNRSKDQKMEPIAIEVPGATTYRDLGFIFVYLVDDDDKCICFWKGNPEDFSDEDPEFQWYALNEDKAVNALEKSHMAGIIQFKMNIRPSVKEKDDQSLNVSLSKKSTWGRKPQIRLNVAKVRCYIFMCKDLPCVDSDGGADPYVTVYRTHGKNFKGCIINENLNPIFYETCELSVPYVSFDTAPPVLIDAWDVDSEGAFSMFDSDDFMGRAVIHLKDASVTKYITREDKVEPPNLNKPPEPKWHQIRRNNQPNGPPCGEILCSFVFVDDDYLFDKQIDNVNLSDHVETTNYQVEINALGLRQLATRGILPISKAFVRFNTKSLLPPDKAKTATSIQTEPKNPGPSPNILTTLKFQTELPVKELYCPRLSCEVFDMVLKGFSQPKLGSFTIEIGDTLHRQIREKAHLLSTAKKAIKYTNMKLNGISVPEISQLSIDERQKQVDSRANQKKKNLYIKGISDDAIEQREIEAQPIDISIIENQQYDSDFQHVISPTSQQIRQRPNFESEDEDMKDDASIDLNRQNIYLPPVTDRHSQENQSSQAPRIQSQGSGQSSRLSERRIDQGYQSSDMIAGPQFLRSSLADDIENAPAPPQDEVTAIEEEQEEFNHSQCSHEIGAGMTERTSQMTFKSNTVELRQVLIDIIEGSQYELPEDDIPKQKLYAVNNFKKGLFAKCTRKRNDGQAMLLNELKLMKERRELELKRDPTDTAIVDRNALLLKNEKQIIEHIQENKKNQKLLEKENAKLQKELEEERQAEQGLFSNITLPTYEKCPRLDVQIEVNKPANSVYIPVGYDSYSSLFDYNEQITFNKEITFETKKHYRKFTTDELENDTQIFNRIIFQNLDILRGQEPSSGGLFGGGDDDEDENFGKTFSVGYFKGMIDVYQQQDHDNFQKEKSQVYNELCSLIKQTYDKKFPGQTLEFELNKVTTAADKMKLKKLLKSMDLTCGDIIDFLMEYSLQEMISSAMATTVDCVVRLYLLDGFEFASRDIVGFSDPFAVIRCGYKEFSTRDEYQIDEPNPNFFKCFEFSAKFPGSHPIEIEAWDYDLLFGDELIGKTVVDLDDRYFNPEWKAIEYKPIEYRELYHPSTALPQGTVLCWVDIFKQDEESNECNRKFDITPEPIEEYELRLSVYDTKDVPGDMNDIFIKAWIDEKDKKETDTHWRCSTGEGSFNYRLKYNVKAPLNAPEAYNMTLQIYDRELIGSNVLLVEYQLDLRLLMEDCMKTQKNQHLNKTYSKQHFEPQYYVSPTNPKPEETLDLEWKDDDSFWLKAYPIKVEEGEDPQPAYLRLDIRVLPMEKAKVTEVGGARSDPNNSPELPAPVGRMEFSLNPFSMLAQLLGPELMAKMVGCLCITACCALLVAMAPMIISGILTKLITG